MAKLIAGMTMSLDGFIHDQTGSVGRLYPDLAALGQTDMLQESIRTTGAVVMGRHAYDMANGDFTGYEFQVPIFVVTHEAPQTVAGGENGRLRFHFMTDGVESAVAQAKAAAGDLNVTAIGGANITVQLIKARLVDELEVGIAPILLGGGLRLFERLGEQIELERTRIVEVMGFTYLYFRVVR